jgi:TonB family protein
MRILFAALLGSILAAPSSRAAEPAPPAAEPAAPAPGRERPAEQDAPPAPPAAEPAPAGTLTRAPELVEFVAAEYPPEAEAAGVEGAVVLSIVIGEDGEVRQAVVVDPGPHPGFAAAALHAVQQFRFRPAEIDGAPAAVEIEYRYEFVLRKVAPPPPAEAPIVLSGRILERGTRAPVAGATVESQGVVAETDAEGRFALRGVAPGDVIVRIASPEHEPLSLRETIEEGRRREVEYRVTRRRYDPYEAVVQGERERREVSVHTLETEEVRTVPGTQGDTLKIIQNLPGVARSPFGIGLLVVRGSEPTETVVYVDGVPIPLLFHFGGLTSVVNADVVEAIEFFPGNFGPRYGRGLGGAVELRTQEPARAWHGAAQLDVWDGRLEVEGPVGSGSAYAAIRRSWIDAVLAVVLPRVDPEAADDLRVAPRYYDYQAKLTAPVLGGQGSVFAYGSDDLLAFVEDDDAPGRPTFKLSTLFHRFGASWRRPIGPATNDLVVAVGRDSFDVLRGGAFGLLTEIRSLTVRDALSWRASDALRLDLGADLLVRRLDYSVYAAPADAPGTVGDELDESPSTVAESAAGTWLSPAVYAEVDWRAVPRLRLVGGVRVDSETRFGRTKAWVDPRLSAFLDARPGTTIFAGAGLFGSTPEPQETSETFGNPDLDPERALHLTLGARQDLPFGARLELTGFYKWLWSLVVPTGAVDAEQRPLRYSNAGKGRNVGLELLLRRELARGLFGWLAWTWSRSERLDDPTDDPRAWRPFVLDQTHVLAFVLSYRLPGDWILGTRLRAVSGNPYTAPDGYVLDADSGRAQCLPSSRRLGSRLPGFFQADARLDKRFVFERWMLGVYLDVQNVTNRENAEFRLQNYSCTDDVPVPSIPIFPAFGLRAEW